MIGDSNLFIDWLKGYTSLNTSLLDQWMVIIRELIRIFKVISFDKIHKELNSNHLSRVNAHNILVNPQL